MLFGDIQMSTVVRVFYFAEMLMETSTYGSYITYSLEQIRALAGEVWAGTEQ